MAISSYSDISNDGLSTSSTSGTGSVVGAELQKLEQLFEDLLQAMSNESSATGGQPDPVQSSSPGATLSGPAADASTPVFPLQAAQEAPPSSAASSPTSAAGISPLASVSAPSAGSTPDASASTSSGSGSNSITITNTSNHDEKIGEFMNGGSTAQPTAEIDLQPGQTGKLSYANGQGGFDAEANSSGQFQPTAARLEFYADQNGLNSPDISDIDGRNASISLSDGHGSTAGDTKSVAADAPTDTISRDAAGNPTIAGWYDGSTQTMQDGGAYLQSQLGTGNTYIHPDDDRNQTADANPMTMAEDSSQTYIATFGNA